MVRVALYLSSTRSRFGQIKIAGLLATTSLMTQHYKQTRSGLVLSDQIRRVKAARYCTSTMSYLCVDEKINVQPLLTLYFIV